jgi:amidohydrolase
MDAKEAARGVVLDNDEALIALSHRIHADPELCFEEEHAAEGTATMLNDAGFTIETGVADLPTAYVATYGSGPLVIGICAEYDALPGVGHACGHNIIAASAVGAGLALARVADELGLTVTVFGTPAEEGGGGKVLMIERGAFDDVHASMMVHPAPFDVLEPRVSAVAHIDVRYTGRESHAAAAPELGINAADAFTVAQVGIGLLRQHLRPTDQVHGVVLRGGDAANIVPAHTEADYMIRATTIDELGEVLPRVERCFEAGALATGAHLDIAHVAPVYAHMVHDHDLVTAYRDNCEALGRHYDPDAAMTFSTDMGNVSLKTPSIHPCIAIESAGAVNHQPDFAAACVNASADRAVREGAIGLAWTAIDAARGPLRERLLAR